MAIVESSIDEISLEVFALGQVPTSAALSDTSAAILAADADRAYATIMLLSVTAGDVYIARGQTALDVKGIKIEVEVPLKFYGPEVLNGICGTGAATAVVIVQDYKRGIRRIGTAA